MDQRQQQQVQAAHANDQHYHNGFNDPSSPSSNSHNNHQHMQHHQHQQQQQQHQQQYQQRYHRQDSHHPAWNQQQQPEKQRFHHQQPFNQSQYTRKPSLRTNTSSSTTYSTISSMTSASSSVGSPAGFSPSWASPSFAPSPSSLGQSDKSHERTFAPATPYSPEHRQHIFTIDEHQSQGSAPVVEQSVSPRRRAQPRISSSTSNELGVANFDTSGTSISSGDTVSHAEAPQQSLELSLKETKSEVPKQLDRSSSSSSSSSSILSRSSAGREPYETPATGSLNQDDAHKRSELAKAALDTPGYPFPSVKPSSDQQARTQSAKTAQQQSEDPWKHTDDLLAPCGKASGKLQSSPASAASRLSLSKPSLADTASEDAPASSQASTPIASDMDRRDSQSSAASSGFARQTKSATISTSKVGAMSVTPQSGSTTNTTKPPTSASPATSTGMASFSPLSPLVQPFSPSSNAANLPGKLLAMPSTASSAFLNSASRPAQSQSTVPASEEHTERASVVRHQETSQTQQKAQESHGHLEASVASSSGDTGYFSEYAPPRHDQTYQANSSAQTAYHGGYPDDYPRARSMDCIPDAHSVKQRAWSENEAIGVAAGPVYAGAGVNPIGPSANYAPSHWAQSQQAIPEHDEASFIGVAQPTGHGYADPRYARHPAGYGIPASAVAASFHPRATSAMRGLPVARSIDSFEAGHYGYGPPSVSDVSTAGNEEISTIFVVGFPEDIQEREFQNMFLFARGFEAATLKIPASTAAARERDAAAAAAVSAIAATLPAFSAPPPPPALDPKHGYGSGLSSAGGSSYDHLNNSLYEEAFLAAASGPQGSGPHGHVENAHRVSSALAAAALTATASTASLANTTNKKQIIGFAKFRAREDAMLARDLLSGRKIDPEKGCVLKAEMAKKNLHIKKNGSEIQGSSLAPLVLEATSVPSREGTSALDRLAERERQSEWHARMATSSGAGQQYDHRAQYAHESEYEEGDEQRRESPNAPSARKATWPEAAYAAFHSIPPEASVPVSFTPEDRRSSTSALAGQAMSGRSMHTLDAIPSDSHPSAAAAAARHRALTGTSNFGKSLLQQLDDQDDAAFPLPDPSPGFGASAYSSGTGEQGNRRQPPPASLPTTSTGVNTGSLGGHTYLDEDYRKLALTAQQEHGENGPHPMAYDPSLGHQSAYQAHTYNKYYGANATTPTSATVPLGVGGRRFTSPDLVSPTLTEFRQPRTQNRADDNMPISTLYVGGLPSSLPSLAGSVSASQLEDALRNVFSRCPGFRRMSYRHKSQGPMCFIEFEDTQHATRALNEIYGHTLGGLVKGGIRLAYSKNPLGVRGSGSNGPDSPTPLSPGYFASDVYSQSSYYGSPSAGPHHPQVPTPTINSRSGQHDTAQNHTRVLSDPNAAPSSQQHFHYNQHGYPDHPANFHGTLDQRHTLERRATSPASGPGSAFSPFTMGR